MKKIIAIISVAAFAAVLGLAACQKQEAPKQEQSAPTSTASAPTTTAPAEKK